ncbi:MAG: polysaccharide biosynthesis protein [Chitinophagaceae bacterium BSSC1]|nr:MAG: polysaccharide biosynthesis protein [Chitinophagaceae bacterium BSSC1]
MFKKVNIVPRWMILLLDLSVTKLSLFLAIVIKQNLSLIGIGWKPLINTLLLMGIINTVVFGAMKTFAGIVRYTGLQDAIRIAISIFISSIVLLLFGIYTINSTEEFILNNVVIILYATFSFLGLISYRVFVKFVFAFSRNYKMQKKYVVIFGAGEAGVATKRVLEHDTQNNISLLAFIDDDKKKNKKVLDGIPIVTLKELANLVKDQPIDELVIASFVISTKRKNELVDFCLDHDIKVLNVPPYSQWTEGSFASRQLRVIKIEELLERETIHIDNEEIRHQIAKKRVLVTGAAGSIGSEIVRQLLPYHPEMIILCDQAETPLHALELELNEAKTNVNYIPFLADITNEQRMEYLFEQFKPNYVYHAAAYKHVPMMEICPSEAIKNNIIGTRNIADLAVKYHVERFVMVSTDKAVNPTNVMGASKRLAEIYVQGLSKLKTHSTRFITTRFGNVLGSNGSVIIRFKEQIESGGPVTVTHPNITRYFMTIPEACGLVLEAGSMGNGGEIFVFDMGQPVAIAELAKKMIRLYGLIPNIDINIKYTGLRPGEKLYEELLSDEESTIPTHHQKILIAKVRPVEFEQIEPHFNSFNDLLKKSESEMMLVTKMKELVPEFVSNNSVFEELDTKGKIVQM